MRVTQIAAALIAATATALAAATAYPATPQVQRALWPPAPGSERSLAHTPAGNGAFAATVNGEGIPVSEVRDLCYETAGTGAVSRLIELRLVDQAAAQAKVTVTDADIDDVTQRLRADIAPKTIDDIRREQGLSPKMFGALLHEQAESEKLIDKTVPPTRLLHLREIVVSSTTRSDDEASAIIKTVQDDFKHGDSFEQLAAMYNENPFTRQSHGDLGIASPEASLEPGMWNMIQKYQTGQTIGPIKVRSGYRLIAVVSTGESHPASENAEYAAAERDYRLWVIGLRTPGFLKNLVTKARIVNNVVPGQPGVPGAVAATVNGQPISVDEVTDVAYNAAADRILGELVDFRLIDQAAGRQGLTVTPDDINAKWNDIIKDAPSMTKDQYAQLHGISMDLLNNILQHRALEDKLVEAQIKPGPMAHAREIAIVRLGSAPPSDDPSDLLKNDPAAKAVVNDVLSKLNSGVDFRYLANLYNRTPGHPNNNGEMGIVYDAPPFDHNIAQAVLAMKNGETSAAAVVLPQACYFFQIVSTLDDHPAYEDAKYADAEAKYRASQLEADREPYMDSLRRQAKIVRYLPE